MGTIEKTPARYVRCALVLLAGLVLTGTPPSPTAAEERAHHEAEVYRIPSAGMGGLAFKLVYDVPVPMHVFWRFKTDFGADFLASHKYIASHRLVERTGDVFVTETRYTRNENTPFRWQTTLYPSAFQMRYRLLNADECGQRFNFGTIRLEALGTGTRVTHTSYFDFFGAFIWSIFPGQPGMDAFLRYTARWEQETVKLFLDRYSD